MKQYQKGIPTGDFPVVCTSYEMVLRDHAALSKIDWAFIVVVCVVYAKPELSGLTSY